MAAVTAVPQWRVKDYWELLKPRVMWLVGFSAAVGYALALFATGYIPALFDMMLSLSAIILGSGAAGALNMWYEADKDALMSRTLNRPICAGRVTRRSALCFALVCAAIAIGVLLSLAHWLTAMLLAVTILYYAWLYTVWLKPRTPQSIVIGGAAGAIAPVLGWTAAGASVTSPEPWLYVLIIFLWTPPHFWALALNRVEEYDKADIPVLPSVKGVMHTRKAIVHYAFLLLVALMLPVLFSSAGWFYAVTAFSAGAGFCWQCLQLYKMSTSGMKVFAGSIFLLFIVLSAALIDQWIA